MEEAALSVSQGQKQVLAAFAGVNCALGDPYGAGLLLEIGETR